MVKSAKATRISIYLSKAPEKNPFQIVTVACTFLLLLHLVLLLENGWRQMYAVGFQALQAKRLVAAAAEFSEHLAARADAGALEFEDILHLHLVVFDAGHFTDGDHLARAVAHPRHVNDEVDGRGELLADYLIRHV